MGWRGAAGVGLGLAIALGLGAVLLSSERQSPDLAIESPAAPRPQVDANGRPVLEPRPTPAETLTCQVVVVGGSLGGVAAAAQAMRAGATTCLIELTPWLGGQISAQGVAAVDESLTMRADQNFSPDWLAFKAVISQQAIALPAWSAAEAQTVADINRCWVGTLCFPPSAGATAATQWLAQAAIAAPASQWRVNTAFKGAEFDATGQEITAIYAVQRQPREAAYVPSGRFSQDLAEWYSWSASDRYTKTPLRLQAPPGDRLLVIDATDTGELVGWANLPHRLGSEARTVLGEEHGSDRSNPDCTQAFTYPFVVAIHADQGQSLAPLPAVTPAYSRAEHERQFDLEGFPVFSGRSFFNYRRIVSTTRNDPFQAAPVRGDMTMVNWNRGNDWTWMNPPLLLTAEQLAATGQPQNWLGGQSAIALSHGENHALLFAAWLLTTQAQPDFPLAYLAGADTPMGTRSGLSMVPYIREGRRIWGRSAYGDAMFMMREADLRLDQPGGRDFSPTVVAVTHYDIDIHGCRYRNGEPSGEAASAPAREFVVRPVQIPLEALIPQGVDNVLIGGKAIAVSHIVNAVTRVHYSEWGVGAAAGTIAGWLVTQPDGLDPSEIVPQGQMPAVQQHLVEQGLCLTWSCQPPVAGTSQTGTDF